MKIIGYILAVYLVLLAAVPCCAFDDCPDDKMETTADHENGDQDCGSCSPFFSCEGCATASIAYHPVSFEITVVEIPVVYAGYIQSTLPHVHFEFWQPPRIG